MHVFRPALAAPARGIANDKTLLRMLREDIGLTEELIDIINNLFLSPIYFIMAIFGDSVITRIVTYLYVPLLCFLAYLMGNKGIRKKPYVDKIKKFFKKFQPQ